MGINWWTLTKVNKEGKVAIPSRTLLSFINFLPNKKVVLEKKDKSLSVECEKLKTQIKGVSPEDFPIIPQISKTDFIEIDSIIFCQSLNQVVDIATPSQARPEISGIYFSFQKNLIKIAATDSFRLGEKSLFYEKLANFDKEVSFILPQKTAKEIINIFGEQKEKLKIYFSPNQVLFENQMSETSHPQVQLISRLIEGEYPAYQEIIPKKYQTQITLNKNELLNQIKIASLFSAKTNEINLKINPKKEEIEISSQNTELGEHYSVLSGKVKGEALEISFNHRFLIDGLSIIKTPEVIFELNGEKGPGVLKPLGDSTYIYVVMPIKTD